MAAPRKSFRRIITDAAFTAISGALIAGLGYWALVQWVEAFSPDYSPATIVTETTYIIFVP